MDPIIAVYLVKVTVRAPEDTAYHSPTNDQVGVACVNGIAALFESEQVEANATSVERTDD
jgi:hypothetical protein